MTRRTFLTASAAVVGVAVVPRALDAAAREPWRVAHLGAHEGRFTKGALTLVSGYTVEGHHFAGQTIAGAITRYGKGTRAVLTVVASAADALRLLQSGGTTTAYGHFGVDLALVESDELHASIAARRELSELQALCTLPPHFLHVVALSGSPLQWARDVKGQRVSLGASGSRTEKVVRRFLAASDMSLDDLRRESLPPGASMKALAEHRLDAFAWHGPVSTDVFERLPGLLGIRLTLLPLGDESTGLAADGGRYYAGTLSKGTYSWLERDARALATANYLLCRRDLPLEVGYRIVKALQSHLDATLPGMGGSGRAEPAPPVPLHPGALRFAEESQRG